MATTITAECINCGACIEECPNQAIAEGADIHEIDPARCTECVGFHELEACQAVCPVECCVPDAEHPEAEDVLAARALGLHPGDSALRSRLESKSFPSRFRVK